MMNTHYEVLGWTEQSVLTLPPFRRYLIRSFFQIVAKLFIIISSALMVSAWWCDDAEPAATLSMLFATLLMMIDFIIPCVTDRKFNILIAVFSSLICLTMAIYIGIVASSSLNCSQSSPFPFICLSAWALSLAASITQLIIYSIK